MHNLPFMKKQLFLFTAAMCFVVSSYAQFGMQLGCNISSYRFVTGGTSDPRGLKFGLNAGILYRTPGKYFGLQPTLLYSQKGCTRDNPTYGTPIEKYRNKLDYLEASIPVLIKLPFAGPKNTFDMGAGPYFGKLIAAYSKAMFTDGHKTKTGFKIGNSATDGFTATDYGLCLYLGGRFTHFNMSLVYNIGFADVDPQSGESIKNRCFSYNFGVFF
jgi:hypothetical protein